MPRTNTLTIRVPEELKERIENTAIMQGVSINGKRDEIIKGFDEAMAKVKAREVEDWDRI